jgi:hypothetical protein
MRLTPGLRRYVLWMAHLALVIYVAQIVAIDHWHQDPGATTGVQHSNAHAKHCHGSSSSAEGASVSTAILKPAMNPLPPEPRFYDIAPSVLSPDDAYVDTLLEPPRAA